MLYVFGCVEWVGLGGGGGGAGGGGGVATWQASLPPWVHPPGLIAFHYSGTTVMLLLTECFAVIKSGSCFPK